MTSWIRAWFFIVFLAFMILNFFIVIISWLVMKSKIRRDEPNDGGLDDVFAVLINCFQDIGRFGLDFSLDRQVEVDADLLRFEVYEEKEKANYTNVPIKKNSNKHILGFKSYWSVSSLINTLALTSTASTCVKISFEMDVAATNSSNDIVSFWLYCSNTAIWYEDVIKMYFWFK